MNHGRIDDKEDVVRRAKMPPRWKIVELANILEQQWYLPRPKKSLILENWSSGKGKQDLLIAGGRAKGRSPSGAETSSYETPAGTSCMTAFSTLRLQGE